MCTVMKTNVDITIQICGIKLCFNQIISVPNVEFYYFLLDSFLRPIYLWHNNLFCASRYWKQRYVFRNMKVCLVRCYQ